MTDTPVGKERRQQAEIALGQWMEGIEELYGFELTREEEREWTGHYLAFGAAIRAPVEAERDALREALGKIMDNLYLVDGRDAAMTYTIEIEHLAAARAFLFPPEEQQ